MSLCKYCNKPMEDDRIFNPDENGDGYHLSCLNRMQFEARDQKIYNNGYEQAKKDVIKVIHKYFVCAIRSTPPTEYIDGEPYHKLGDISNFLTTNKELCGIIKSLEAPNISMEREE